MLKSQIPVGDLCSNHRSSNNHRSSLENLCSNHTSLLEDLAMLKSQILVGDLCSNHRSSLEIYGQIIDPR